MENLYQQLAPILDQVSQATGLDLTALASAANQQASSSNVPPLATSVPDVLHSHLPRIREGQVIHNGVDSRSTSGQGSDHDDPAVKIEDDVSDAAIPERSRGAGHSRLNEQLPCSYYCDRTTGMNQYILALVTTMIQLSWSSVCRLYNNVRRPLVP